MDFVVPFGCVGLFLAQIAALNLLRRTEVEEVLPEEEDDMMMMKPMRKQSVPVSSPRWNTRVWSSVDANLQQLPPEFGVSMSVGQRKTMEDHATISISKKEGIFMGIYDGHGTDKVAMFCASNMHALYQEQIANGANDPQSFWTSLYRSMHDRIGLDIGRIGGTCAVTVTVCNGWIQAANVGDSRALLVSPTRGVLRLSYDHKASDPMEEADIKSRGGVVFSGRLSGILEVSRTLGDLRGEKYISRVPHVQTIAAAKEDILVLASDGLFEKLTDDEVGVVVGNLSKFGAQKVADALLETAMKRGSSDNTSLIVFFL